MTIGVSGLRKGSIKLFICEAVGVNRKRRISDSEMVEGDLIGRVVE